MKTAQTKVARIRQELIEAGVTPYGMSKSEAKSLYDYLGDNEHVVAVVYGQVEGSSAMMVASDRRLVFLDIRALHIVEDEASYYSFGDISVDEGVAFSKVEIRTKPRNYSFRMVNKRCARRFLNAMERLAIDPAYMRTEAPENVKTTKTSSKTKSLDPKLLRDDLTVFDKGLDLDLMPALIQASELRSTECLGSVLVSKRNLSLTCQSH